MSPERALRIAVVHGYYSTRVPSGENVVVDLQVEALRAAGHEVAVFARHQEEVEQSPIYPLQAALRTATGRGFSPIDALDRFGPDIVQVHNLFPNFGRTWVRRYADRLVATLHNYRPICPAATLFRDGHACTECPDQRSALPALRHACFKDSRVATLPMVPGTRFAADPLLDAAARVVTLNDDMRRRYAAIGVPESKLVTVPNFVRAAAAPGRHDGDFWLYVGRLSAEKGILPLVQGWPVGPVLRVVGAGPLEAEVRAAAGPTVEVMGQVDGPRVRTLLGRARGLFFPSLWPEGLPTVYLEALAAGLPVVASPESVVADLVTREGTGFVSGGSVDGDLARATAEFPDMSDHCRAAFDARYTEVAWVRAMEELFRGVIGERAVS